MLGQGGFGSVFKGKNKETGQYVAIKYIDLTEYCKILKHKLFSEECKQNRRNFQRS